MKHFHSTSEKRLPTCIIIGFCLVFACLAGGNLSLATALAETETVNETQEAAFDYDARPVSIEEVQTWIDSGVKPKWESEVDTSLMPAGYRCDFLKDEETGIIYWTWFVSLQKRALYTINTGATTSSIQTIIDNAAAGDTIQFQGDITLDTALTVDKSLIFKSVSGSVTITSPAYATNGAMKTGRHMIVTGGALTLTFDGVTLKGNSSYPTSDTHTTAVSFVCGGIDSSAASLTVDGITITECHSSGSSADGVADGTGIRATGDLTLINCNITNNINGADFGGCSTSGGGVAVNNGSGLKLIVESCTFTGNKTTTWSGTAANSGAGIYFNSANGKIMLRNSNISDSEASFGGGLFIGGADCNLTMSATVFENNTAIRGGGVYVEAGTAYLNGNTVIENCSAKRVAMAGGGMTAGGTGGGIHVTRDGNLEMTDVEIRDNYAESTGGGVSFSGVKLDMGNNVKITGNVAYESQTLGGEGGGVHVSSANSIFTMSGNAEIDGSQNSWPQNAYVGGGVFLTDGYMIMKDTAIIKNCHAQTNGGGINIAEEDAGLEMQGNAVIQNCSASQGGGIAVIGGELKLYDNSMVGGTTKTAANTADYDGGGIYFASLPSTKAEMIFNGGAVSYNVAGRNGGGIFMSSGGSNTVKMTGGEIYGNEAAGYGGGVYMNYTNLSYKAALTMTGGKIGKTDAPNKALNGGGIYINRGVFSMNDAAAMVSNNEAAAEGGGVYVYGPTSTTHSAQFDLGEGMVSGNTAGGNGGGCYINNAGSMTATGGNITGNKAPNGHGGGIYTAKAKDGYTNLTVETAAVFSGNTASVNYNPPDQDIVNTGIWPTITNYTSSLVAGTGTNRVLPVNNDDINVVTYTVDFYAPVSAESLSTFSHYGEQQTVAQYCKAVKPADPVVTNADFIDWYETSGLIKVYDFNSPIIEETNIYAKMVKTISFTFNKVDDETNAALPKAEFILYKWKDENSSPGANAIVAAGSTDWDKVGGTQISGDIDGLISFSGLTTGIYQLVEEKAPQGYELPAGQWRFTVSLSSVSGEYVIGSISSITEAGGEAPPNFAPALPGGSGDRTLPNKKTSYLSFTFKKVKAEDIEAPLAGAEFKLYIWKGNGTAPDVMENASITSGDWELVDTQTSADSGTNIGEVVFSGLLKDKVYQLVETKAPSGYSRPMGQWRLTADPSGNWTILGKGSVLPPAFADVSGKYILPNMKGKFFPLTGFGGILNYLVAGLGIMAAAAAGIVFLLFSQKRKIKINKLLLKKEVGGGTEKRFKETCDN